MLLEVDDQATGLFVYWLEFGGKTLVVDCQLYCPLQTPTDSRIERMLIFMVLRTLKFDDQ